MAQTPIGSLLILHNQALALLPQFYLGSALIVGGFKPQQQLWRAALLKATLVGIVLEVAWNGLHPAALPQRRAAKALLGALLLNALHLATIYGLSGLEYTAELAFALHLARGVLLVPVKQIGNVWTLEAGTEQSQARWRIGGWIVTVALGLAVLLLPILAESPACVFATVSLPSALMAFVMLRGADSEKASSAAAAAATRRNGGSGGGGACGGGSGTGGDVPARVSWPRALLFLLGACLLGTNGEAMLDSAVGLTVRQSLVRGKSGLALANQTAVLLSMLLALLSEVVLLKGSAASRSVIYIALWLGVQIVRSAGFAYLADDFQGALLVWAFVFVDKYTGPLGEAAVETSLLVTLQHEGGADRSAPADDEPTTTAGRSRSRSPAAWSSTRQRKRSRSRSASPAKPVSVAAPLSWTMVTVPGAMLLTMRHVVESSSRPFFELLLTPPTTSESDGAGSHWPLRFECVVLALAAGTTAFVLLTLRQGSERDNARAKLD